jgi:HEAT repeat protein
MYLHGILIMTSRLDQDDIKHLLAQLEQHRRNLRFLARQASKFGASYLPLPIHNQIIDEQESIKTIRQRLVDAGVTIDFNEDTDNIFDTYVLQDIPDYIKRAVIALDSANPDERRSGIESLAQTDHPLALKALRDATCHAVRDVRVHASLQLAEFDDELALPGLVDALKDWEKWGDHGWPVQRSFMKFGVRATAYLLEALTSVHKNIRFRAALLLGDIKDLSSLSGLISALNDQDRDVRSFAARSLGSIGDDSAIIALINAMDDEDVNVRLEAIGAQATIRSSSATPALIKALNDEDASVRCAAIGSLGAIRDKQAIPHLIMMLEDKGSDVSSSAVQSLINFKDEAIADLRLSLFERNSEVRRLMVQILEQMQTEAAGNLLIEWDQYNLTRAG